VLVGNKNDLGDKRKVSVEEGEALGINNFHPKYLIYFKLNNMEFYSLKLQQRMLIILT